MAVLLSTASVAAASPTGAITEFSSELNGGSEPSGITPGADGNLWFTDEGIPTIGWVTPNTGAIAELSTGLNPGSRPRGITTGPEGDLWFTDRGTTPAIGQATLSGAITEFSAGLTPGSKPLGVTLGPDSNLWFTDPGTDPAIGQITPSGTITEFSAGLNAGSGPVNIAPGADGNLWFADQGTKPAIGQIGAGAAPALAAAPIVSGGDRVGVPQSCSDVSWTSWSSLQPSTSLFSFDGYRWLLGGSEVASGPSYTPTEAGISEPLSCEVTITYPLLGVTTSATSAPVTAPPPTPTITRVRQSAQRWREGVELARIARKHKPPVGTTISFTASEQVIVTLSFVRLLTGRMVAHRCIAASRKDAARRHCQMAVPAGTLSFEAHSGANQIAFQGRISAKHRLAAGRYTLTITATNFAGLSTAPEKLRFIIVKK